MDANSFQVYVDSENEGSIDNRQPNVGIQPIQPTGSNRTYEYKYKENRVPRCTSEVVPTQTGPVPSTAVPQSIEVPHMQRMYSGVPSDGDFLHFGEDAPDKLIQMNEVLQQELWKTRESRDQLKNELDGFKQNLLDYHPCRYCPNNCNCSSVDKDDKLLRAMKENMKNACTCYKNGPILSIQELRTRQEECCQRREEEERKRIEDEARLNVNPGPGPSVPFSSTPAVGANAVRFVPDISQVLPGNNVYPRDKEILDFINQLIENKLKKRKIEDDKEAKKWGLRRRDERVHRKDDASMYVEDDDDINKKLGNTCRFASSDPNIYKSAEKEDTLPFRLSNVRSAVGTQPSPESQQPNHGAAGYNASDNQILADSVVKSTAMGAFNHKIITFYGNDTDKCTIRDWLTAFDAAKTEANLDTGRTLAQMERFLQGRAKVFFQMASEKYHNSQNIYANIAADLIVRLSEKTDDQFHIQVYLANLGHSWPVYSVRELANEVSHKVYKGWPDVRNTLEWDRLCIKYFMLNICHEFQSAAVALRSLDENDFDKLWKALHEQEIAVVSRLPAEQRVKFDTGRYEKVNKGSKGSSTYIDKKEADKKEPYQKRSAPFNQRGGSGPKFSKNRYYFKQNRTINQCDFVGMADVNEIDDDSDKISVDENEEVIECDSDGEIIDVCTFQSEPKKCHECKSTSHLIRECPIAKAKRAEVIKSKDDNKPQITEKFKNFVQYKPANKPYDPNAAGTSKNVNIPVSELERIKKEVDRLTRVNEKLRSEVKPVSSGNKSVNVVTNDSVSTSDIKDCPDVTDNKDIGAIFANYMPFTGMIRCDGDDIIDVSDDEENEYDAVNLIEKQYIEWRKIDAAMQRSVFKNEKEREKMSDKDKLKEKLLIDKYYHSLDQRTNGSYTIALDVPGRSRKELDEIRTKFSTSKTSHLSCAVTIGDDKHQMLADAFVDCGAGLGLISEKKVNELLDQGLNIKVEHSSLDSFRVLGNTKVPIVGRAQIVLKIANTMGRAWFHVTKHCPYGLILSWNLMQDLDVNVLTDVRCISAGGILVPYYTAKMQWEKREAFAPPKEEIIPSTFRERLSKIDVKKSEMIKDVNNFVYWSGVASCHPVLDISMEHTSDKEKR